jgi:hypothetical protein
MKVRVALVALLLNLAATRSAAQIATPRAPLPPDVHPEAVRLQALYNLRPTAFFEAIGERILDRVPKAQSFSNLANPLWSAPGAPPRLTEAFFEQLSELFQGRPLRAGLADGVINDADLRAASFFAPYATEFMGMWSGFDGTPGYPQTPADALREIGLQAAQHAHLGVTLVKLWYPFQAWMYRFNTVGGTATSLRLQDVLEVLINNGLDVIVTLGNSYGDGSLQTGAPDISGRFVFYSQPTPGVGLPMPSTAHRMVLLDREPTKGQSFYHFPGNDYLQLLGCPEFNTFRAGEWTQYVNHVLDVLDANPSPHVRTLQLWNEPDGSRCPQPDAYACVPPPVGWLPGQPRPCVTVPVRVAQLMKTTRDLLGLPNRAALAARLPLMVGCGGTASMLLFSQVFDSVVPPGVEPGFLRNHVRWYGFHPTSLHMYQGANYDTVTGSPGGPVSKYPGWPPGIGQPASFLKKSDQGSGRLVYEIGVNDEIGQFIVNFPATTLVIEEAAMRGIVPQVLTDVDQSLRDGDQNTVAIGPFVAAMAKGHPFSITLADGTYVLPREELVMQDRWRMGGAGHDANSFQGTGLAGRKVHSHPTGARFSRALRPLLLESLPTTTRPQTHLLVTADAYDDVPTHCHVGTYPASARPNDRHKIWVRAVRRVNGVETETALVPLDSFVTNTQWASLTEDPSFKDVDDNVATSQWPVGMVPTRAVNLSMDPLGTFWFTEPYYHPFGMVPIDLTFGGLPLGTLPIPIPANPCALGGYRADMTAMERELILRGLIAGPLRAKYTGVSGRVRGVYLREEIHSNGEVTHHFALAFHRIVWKRDGISERYGPSDEAWNDPDPVRAWSNNYGDQFANKKDRGLNDPVFQPGKLEVVVVNVAVRDTAGVLGMSGQAEVLPSFGDHTDSAAGITNPGAEAIDPELGAAPDGTLVVAYRKAQDSFFEFPEPPAGTRPWEPLVGGVLMGPTTPGCSGGNYLPVPYPTPQPLKGSWAGMLQSPNFRVWMFPFDLYLRLRSPGGTWSAEQRLSEPVYPGTSYRQEDWSQWVATMKDLENRSGGLRLVKGLNAEPYFHQDWVHSDLTLPPVYTYSPHTWHPALRPSVSVGARTAGNLEVSVAWSQYPGSARVRALADQTAYVTRGLKLTFDASNLLIGESPGNGYYDFGSSAAYQQAATAGSPVGASVRGPASVLHREGAAPWAVYQLGVDAFEANGNALVRRTQQTAGTYRLRTPLAATTPRIQPGPGSATELELSASLAPIESAATTQRELRIRATMPGRNSSTEFAPAGAVTTDPFAQVVAVVPRGGAVADASPPSGESHAMAYDSRRRVTVLFAGTSRQTWEWDGHHWTRRVLTTNPPLRSSHVMAYDAARGMVVLLGGQYVTFPPYRLVRLNDTWEYDGTDWVQRSPAASPSPFNSGAMVWDSTRQRCVALLTSSEPQLYPWFASVAWEWDGTNWSLHSYFNLPQTPQGPFPAEFGFVYDHARLRLVLFGGRNIGTAGGVLNDTWEYSGTRWVVMNPANRPAARSGHAMVYDPVRQRVVMNGGQGFQDTWEWDGTDWNLRLASGPGGGPMVYESHNQRCFLFSAPWHRAYERDTWTSIDPTRPIGRVVWKADGTIWWADYDWLVNTVTVQKANNSLPGPFPAHQTEVSASGSAVLWTHDGSILTRRL